MIKVHSYDVFDTCLIRKYAFPSDLFIVVGQELQTTLEPVLGKRFAEIFRDVRLEAEARTLITSDYEDVTLEEIWSEISRMIPGIDTIVGVNKELEIQFESILPNPLLLARIDCSRKKEVKIFFISDSCLPSSFILKALIANGFFIDGDKLYVSSECRLVKFTGSLFNFVLDKESIKPHEIFHYGDNNLSDVLIPSKYGIKSQRHVETTLNTAEKDLLAGVGGERMIKSKLVAGMRTFRLGEYEKSFLSENSFVASFLGPFLVVFASWVLSKAQRDGVRRLYFLSRDCYALWCVASKLSEQFGNIDCRYLHVSRQALFLPSTLDISPEGMPWMRRHFEKPILGHLLAKLDLCILSAGLDIAQWAGTAGDSKMIVSENDWNTFWEFLNREPLRGKIKHLINRRKSAALQYFEAQNLMDDEEKGIVDFGWMLTCQGALKSLINSKSSENKLRGYYLGLKHNRLSFCEAGLADALFYADPSDRVAQLDSAHLFQRILLLDHITGFAPHGTVHHYQLIGGNVEPVCADIDTEQFSSAQKLVSLAQKFASENVHLAKSFSSDEVATDILDRLIASCFSKPDPHWCQALSKIRVSADQNNYDAVRLIEPIRWANFFINFLPYSFRQNYKLFKYKRPWSEIDMVASNHKIRNAIKLCQLMNRLLQKLNQ